MHQPLPDRNCMFRGVAPERTLFALPQSIFRKMNVRALQLFEIAAPFFLLTPNQRRRDGG